MKGDKQLPHIYKWTAQNVLMALCTPLFGSGRRSSKPALLFHMRPGGSTARRGVGHAAAAGLPIGKGVWAGTASELPALLRARRSSSKDRRPSAGPGPPPAWRCLLPAATFVIDPPPNQLEVHPSPSQTETNPKIISRWALGSATSGK